MDEQRLESGGRAPLIQGSKIRIAGVRHELELLDDAPPVAGATNALGAFLPAQDGLLALPDEASPDLVVFRDADDSWFVERSEGRFRVQDNDLVHAGELSWRLCLPTVQVATHDNEDGAPDIRDVALHFAVSPDEEHVEVSVLWEHTSAPLKPRAHHYMLLLLARERLKDMAQGVAADECGWLYRDALALMMRCTMNALAVSLFRSRRELAAAGVRGAADLFEVRSVPRKLRIGIPRLTVEER